MPDSSSSHSEASESPSPEQQPSALRRWGRRVLWTIGIALGTLVLLVGAVLLALQTESGATAAAQWLASTANPLPNTELTVDRASGSWIRSLRLTGISLTRTDSTSGTSVQMAEVDTLTARYRLLPLLRGRLHVTDLSVEGPSATMRQDADSTWDWAKVLPEAPEEPDTSAAMPIQVDRIHVDGGAFSARFYAGGRDSTAHIRDLHLLAHDFESDSTVTGRVDTLGLRGQPAGDTTDLRLALRGGLTDSSFTLDALQLTSPRSRVWGQGHVRLPSDPTGTVDDVQLRLQAAPFALRDLTPFAPTLDVDPRETVEIDLHVAGSGQRMMATLDGSFSGGGTVSVEAEATPTTTTSPEGPPLYYRLDAEVRDLTTSLLGPTDTTQNRLNTRIAVDLSGQSLTTLDGTADFRLTDTRWANLHTPVLNANTTLRDGEATIDVEGTLNQARIRANARTRPLDDAPSATLTARVRAFDVAAFAPDAGVESNLSADAEVKARALGSEAQEIDAALTVGSSRVGLQRINTGRATVSVRPDRARFDGRFALPEGGVQAAGFAALDGTEQFALERAQLNRFNVAALIGDTTASRVTGTARLEGRGFSPETMNVDGTVTLRDSHYGPYEVPSLQTQAALDDGRLETSTSATVNGSTWALELTGRPFSAAPRFELARGRFQNVDIGSFLQDTTQSSQLHGTVQGTVQGTDPATMTADAGITLDTSRVNQQRINDASLTLRLQDARTESVLTLDTPEGGLRLAATARPFDTVPTYRVTEGEFDELDVGALAGLPDVRTSLSGSLTVDGRGTTASSMNLDAALSFTESQINDAILSEGRLSVSTGSGRATTDGEFAVAGGMVRWTGRVDSLETTPAYQVRTTVDSIDAGALAGLDTLSAHVESLHWTLDGRGTDPNTLSTSTALSVGNVRVDQFTLESAALRGQFRRGQLALDTLTVQSNAFESWGTGVLAVTDTTASSDFSLRTTVTNPQPLEPLLDAETLRLETGTVKARIYGASMATQRFDGEAMLEGLVYDEIRLAGADIDFNGQRGRDQLFARVGINGTLTFLSTPAVSIQETRLDALYDGETVDLSSTVHLTPNHSGSLDANIVSTSEQTEVTLNKLSLRLENTRWSLQQEATITANDQYRIGGLLLRSGSQQIAVDGVVDFEGTQNLVATIDELQLGPISSLVGLSGLGGTLSGAADLTGPATAPHLESRLSLDLRSENREVGTLRLDASYEELALNLDATLNHTDGSTLTAEGRLPTDLRLNASTPASVVDQPVRLDLSTERFPVNWVDPFLDPATVRDIRGTLAANVEVRGTLDEPDLAGTASLEGGGATLPTLETTYRSATANLRFTEDRITLEKASLFSSNGGRLRAEGRISFPQLTLPEYNLKLNASNFIAIDTRAYRRATIDGTLTLNGTTQRPVLTGTVQVRSADIYFNEALAESAASTATVPLSEEDQLTLEQRFGIRLSDADTTAFDTYDALEMDLTVQIQRNTWLRSQSRPEMNIQFTGDLDVSKSVSEDPQVFGSIEVLPERSTLRQFGQEFQITEGTLTFNGDPTLPYLALEAVYEQRARGSQGNEVTITLRLEGRGEELSPTLSSDPPMDTRNILSYLATGRPADELLSGSGEGENFATQLALGQATNFVENLAASELGLDVVRVELRTSGTSYLTVGRYFTPRFFVSIDQPVTTSNLSNFQSTQYLPDLTLEYQLMDTLMLRALNNQQSLQLNLLFEYAY